MTNEPLNLDEIAPLEARLDELRADLAALAEQSRELLQSAARANQAIQAKQREVWQVEGQIKTLRTEARRRAIEAAWLAEDPEMRPLSEAIEHEPVLVFLDYEEDSDLGDFPAMSVTIAMWRYGRWVSVLSERDYDGGGCAKDVTPICWKPMPKAMLVPKGIPNA